MTQFKILTKAVDLFKQINNGEDKNKLRLHKVEIKNEREFFNHTLFDVEGHGWGVFGLEHDLSALEHARTCAYEILLGNYDEY